MKNNDFEIISLVKKFIISLPNIINLFPNKEKILRDRIYTAAYELLETIYLINDLPKDYYKEERIRLELSTLSKISMLDFLIENAYYQKYISEKKCINLSKNLSVVHQKIKGWINSETANNKRT